MAKTRKSAAKSKPKGKMSLLTKIMVVVNFIFIALLLLSYLSLYVSPEKFWPLAFAGLAYPVFIVLNLFFVLFWLVFLKKYFILSLLAILLGYNQIKTFINFSGSEKKIEFGKNIKVMSYNVRLFDLYNWRNPSGKATRTAIFDLINSESADILCVQEYYSGAGKNADFADTICEKTGYKYRNIELINKASKGLPYGLAVFSKYPIVHTQKLEFTNSKVNFSQVCDIKIGNDTIRFMNLHLESVKFGKEDYNFVSEITSTPSTNDSLRNKSMAIIGKMRYAFIKRAVQVETITQFIRNSPYPVILSGDFNDTPVSYCYKQIASELNDSFVEAGTGLGQTHAQMLPMLRIDYIFHDEKFSALEHRTINKDYSDHFPVVARFQLPD